MKKHRIDITYSKPNIRAFNSFIGFSWAVIKMKWRLRSKRHSIYVYTLLTSVMEIADQTCPETGLGGDSLPALSKDP